MALTGHGAAKRGIVVDKLPLAPQCPGITPSRPKPPQAVFHDPDARTACRYGGREA